MPGACSRLLMTIAISAFGIRPDAMPVRERFEIRTAAAQEHANALVHKQKTLA